MTSRIVGALLVAAFAASGQTRTTNIVLVTADGLRWQELFGGIDQALMNEKAAGMEKAGPLKEKLWRDSPESRRRALMPFFWEKLAPTGVVLGNVSKGSSVRVTNRFRVSYPGYAEILTGRAQDERIRGNAEVPNPVPTVLEFLREKLRLAPSQVALFASWSVFRHIGEHKPGSIFINAGYRQAGGSSRMRELSALQFRAMTPWDTVRHDYVTLEMALEYLRTEKPRVTYIALGETDDWAHDRRYDRTLQAVAYFDEALRQIAALIEESPSYRGRTALVITSDHGRGSTLEDWHSHGSKISGAEQIWIALFGPDMPARGEVASSAPVFQRDIAPTLLDVLGVDYREYEGVEGKPLKNVY
jgi:hypothetical protein